MAKQETIEVVRDDSVIKINKTDLGLYARDGWKKVGKDKPEAGKPKDDAKPKADDKSDAKPKADKAKTAK